MNELIVSEPKRSGPETDDSFELLTSPEVARILKVSESYAYRMIQHGKIPAIRLGKSVRVRKAALRAFIEQQESAPA